MSDNGLLVLGFGLLGGSVIYVSMIYSFGIFISRMTYEETEHSTRVNIVPPFTLPFLYFFGPFEFNIITSPG